MPLENTSDQGQVSSVEPYVKKDQSPSNTSASQKEFIFRNVTPPPLGELDRIVDARALDRARLLGFTCIPNLSSEDCKN